MNKLVSIIIPVYNSSKYIKECLESVIKQTYKNIEIIIINDGSTDDSDIIIKKVIDNEKSKNIIYIMQENQGAGQTRNIGIKTACGEYIAFVDGDDIVEEGYIEELVRNIGENNIQDVIYSGIKYFNNIKLCNSLYQYKIIGPCAKIYKRDFLIKNKIKFLNAKFAEDAYFNLQVILKAKNIKIIDYIGYIYRNNEQGITNTIKKSQIDIHIEEVLDNIYDVWEQNKTENIDKKPYIELYFFISIGFGYLKELCKGIGYKKFKNEYGKVINFFVKNNIKYHKNSLLKFNNIFSEDYKDKVVLKIFFILDEFKLGKMSLWLYNKIIK